MDGAGYRSKNMVGRRTCAAAPGRNMFRPAGPRMRGPELPDLLSFD
jgi:hypothetical protein